MLRRPAPLTEAALPSPRRAWLITWVVLAGAFCVSFTITILSVSRPAIAKDLHADPSSLVWLISGPTLATALVSATFGKLGDLRGHRRTYLFGVVGAMVFALASAAAWDSLSLIGFRVIGALVGAATAPSSMAIINRLFPPERRSAALGYWSLVVAGGPVVGLVVGGPMVDAFGWRMIFLLQAPLMAAAALAAFLIVPETPARRGVRFDFAGQLVLGASVLGILMSIDRGREWGWANPVVIGLLVGGLALLVVLVRVEGRAEDPLLPIQYFRRRTFSVPVAIQFFTNFGYMGGFILAPKLLDEVRGLSPGAISLMLIPRPLVFAICGPIAGYFVPRLGTRLYAFFGGATITASLAILAMVSDDPVTFWVVLAFTISGIGMGSAQPAIAASVANSVEDRDLGTAGATHQLMGMVGSSMGMNLLDTIQVSRAPTVGVTGSFHDAYLFGAIVSAVGMLLSFLLPGRTRVGGVPKPPTDRSVEHEHAEAVRAQLIELP
ncbi:MAG TPA: MFS transporter [Microthrixaceae bacterium]|nr:MFS transporter [Microthrixaceae bacterium]